MPLNRDSSAVDRFDVSGMVLITFTLHHLSIGLMNKPAGVLNGLLRRHVKTPVRHVHHPQTIIASAVNRFGHHHDLIEGHRYCALMPKQNHSAGI